METINIKNELGSAIILYGNNSLSKSIKLYGYTLDEYNIELTDSEKKEIIEISKTLPQIEIILIDWHSKVKNNGFGRSIINKLFDLGDALNVDQFTISLPSILATEILDNYVNKGVLKPINNSLTGNSMNRHHTQYKMIKKPLIEFN